MSTPSTTAPNLMPEHSGRDKRWTVMPDIVLWDMVRFWEAFVFL